MHSLDVYTKHGSTETHDQVTIEQRGNSIQIKTKKRTYQGRINGASLQAEYQPEKIEYMMGKWWSDDGKPMSIPSRESLSLAVDILGHMPVYAYDLTAVDRDHMSGTFTGPHIEWESKDKKKVTSVGQVHWPERMVRNYEYPARRQNSECPRAMMTRPDNSTHRNDNPWAFFTRMGLLAVGILLLSATFPSTAYSWPNYEKSLAFIKDIARTKASIDEAVNEEKPCKCDVKKLLNILKDIHKTEERIKKENFNLSRKLSRIRQELLEAAEQESKSKEINFTKTVAWSAFNLLTDVSMDWMDAAADTGKAIHKIAGGARGIRVAGKAVRKFFQKGSVKVGKVSKTINGFMGSTEVNVSRLKSSPQLHAAADVVAQMGSNQVELMGYKWLEQVIWNRLLGDTYCREALKKQCSPASIDYMRKNNVRNQLDKVDYPYLNTAIHDIERVADTYGYRAYPGENYEEKGFSHAELKKYVMPRLELYQYFEEQTYKYDVVAGQMISSAERASRNCDTCEMLKALKTISDLRDEIDAIEYDWNKVYVGAIKGVIGSHKDLARMWDAQGKPSRITSHPLYQFAGLGFALFSVTSPVGTAFSAVTAVSEISQAVVDLVYKAPVAEEIKRQAKLLKVFADTLKGSIGILSDIDNRVVKARYELIGRLFDCNKVKACLEEQKKPTASFKNPVQGCWRNGSTFSWSDPGKNLNIRYSFKITSVDSHSLRAVMRPFGENNSDVHWNGYYDSDSGIVEFYLVDPEEFISLTKRVFPGVYDNQLDKMRVRYGYDFILRLKLKPSDTAIGSDSQLFGVAKRFDPDVMVTEETGVSISYGGAMGLKENESWGGNLFNLWTRISPTQISSLDVISANKSSPVQAFRENQIVRIRASVDNPCPLGGDEIIVRVYSEHLALFRPFFLTLKRAQSSGGTDRPKAMYLSKPFKLDHINHLLADAQEIKNPVSIALEYRSANKKGADTRYIDFTLNEDKAPFDSFTKNLQENLWSERLQSERELLSPEMLIRELAASPGLRLGEKKAVHPSRFLRVIDKLYPSFVTGWKSSVDVINQWISETVKALANCKPSLVSPNFCEPLRISLAEQKKMRAGLIKAHKEISRQLKELPDNFISLLVHPDSLDSLEHWKAKFDSDIALAESFIQKLGNLRYFPGMEMNMERLRWLRRDMMFVTGLQFREINGEQTANTSPLPAAISVTPEIKLPPSRPASTPQKTKPETEKKRQQSKPVKWTAYKLVVKTHGGRLPTMDVLKLSFQKGKKRAAFKVTRYPVSMIRNDQTGKILWSINWSAGDVAENEMAIQPDMMAALETMANDKKHGGVGKQDITALINCQLGTDAGRKE